MKEKQHTSKWNKKNELSALLVSLALSLTTLFFPASETFLLNPVEFHLNASVAVLPLLLVAIGVGAGFWLILNLCLLINEKLFKAVSLMSFGLLIASYVQLLFYNEKMSVMNGAQDKVWDFSVPFVKINFFVMLAIALLPIFLFLLQLVEPPITSVRKIKWTFVPPVCGAIILMQSLGLGFNIVNYQKLNAKGKSPTIKYLSYEPLLSLSKENNVIVFLTDRLDGTMVDDLLKYYPELNESLDGFTYFSNNISCYTNTFPSVPEMLSGTKYNGEQWMDYITSIWENDNAMKRIHDADYQVNLMIDGNTTYYELDDMECFTDNIRETSYSYNLGNNGVIQNEIVLSLYRVLPYAFKSIPLQFFSVSSDNYIKINEATDFHPSSVGINSDIHFYNYMQDHPITDNCAKKTFSFIHLNASHDANKDFIEICHRDHPSVSGSVPEIQNGPLIINTLRCSFDIIEMYINQMKELDIYDNSTIIILGDHGRAMTAKEEEESKKLDGPITTGLFIKQANAPHADLQINSSAEMSNAFFSASILDYAGLKYDGFGPSYEDICTDLPHVKRTLNLYHFTGFFKKPDFLNSYTVTGDASDFSNWKLNN